MAHETCGLAGLFVTVAIGHFAAGPVIKSLVAAAFPIGLLASPFVVSLVALTGITVSRAITATLAIGGFALLGLGVVENLLFFAVLAVLAGSSMAVIAPLSTEIWRQRVDEAKRGRLFGNIQILAKVAALASAGLISWWMGKEFDRYFAPALVLGGMLLMTAAIYAGQRSRPIEHAPGFPLRKLVWLWRDKLFGYLSLLWMVMGISNLATLPMRADFLVGLGYPPDAVLLLTLVITAGAALLSAPLWGILFDRLNFIVLRMAINVAFALSLLTFFSPVPWMQVAGAVCFGIGQGGGTVAWHLWVTKFAPAERTADYMSVHTFLTGCRGVCGPAIVFAVLTLFPGSYAAIAWTGAGLIFLTVVLLLPVRHLGRRGPLNLDLERKPGG